VKNEEEWGGVYGFDELFESKSLMHQGNNT
jgi:hypothetical protein